MHIKHFILTINLINIAYKHKKTSIKIRYTVNLKPCLYFLYKYNYIKNIKKLYNQNAMFLSINYYKFNFINNKIIFFKKKQNIHVNCLFLQKLNYNYLISINCANNWSIIDKYNAIKLKKNGKLIAITF